MSRTFKDAPRMLRTPEELKRKNPVSLSYTDDEGRPIAPAPKIVGKEEHELRERLFRISRENPGERYITIHDGDDTYVFDKYDPRNGMVK